MRLVLADPVREGRFALRGLGDTGENHVVGQVEGRSIEAVDLPLGGRRKEREKLMLLEP